MMVTFISSSGTSHLGVTACGRKYFTPEPRSSFNMVTCRVCASHLRGCERCQELRREQQRGEEQRT
jgi:hypothetical protein